MLFIQERLLDSHTRSIANFFQFIANGVDRCFSADYLADFFKSSTMVCTYYSSQLSSFPIVKDRRSSRPGLRLYSSIFLPLLVNLLYGSSGIFSSMTICVAEIPSQHLVTVFSF